MRKGRGRGSPAGYIVFVFLFVGAVLALSMCSSRKEAPAPPAAKKDMDFATLLKLHEPQFMQLERDCPVDNTKFKLPSQDAVHDNSFGGIATDMMKLALAPPKQEGGPPELDCQQFDYLLGSCPTCGASFIELDLINMRSGLPPQAMSNLNRNWDLARAAPQLKALPLSEWTFEERALARYLTARTGWEGADNLEVELGFAALQGAYCSNMSLYLGRDYRITAAAFYALAAAHFRHALDNNTNVPENLRMGAQAQAMTAIEIGETNRLLGRREESQAGFDQARQIAVADIKALESQIPLVEAEIEAQRARLPAPGSPEAQSGHTLQREIAKKEQKLKNLRGWISAQQQNLEVIAVLEGYLHAGDYKLHRYTPEGVPAPPIGWYIDMLLPAINGELEVQRSNWSSLRLPEQIVEQMLQQIGPAPAPAAPAAP
jgi:hypothetical protein